MGSPNLSLWAHPISDYGRDVNSPILIGNPIFFCSGHFPIFLFFSDFFQIFFSDFFQKIFLLSFTFGFRLFNNLTFWKYAYNLKWIFNNGIKSKISFLFCFRVRERLWSVDFYRVCAASCNFRSSWKTPWISFFWEISLNSPWICFASLNFFSPWIFDDAVSLNFRRCGLLENLNF